MYVCLFVEISCGLPAAFPNTLREISGLSFRNTITYSCDLGYKYVGGDIVSECLADGAWNGDPIQCEGKWN